MFPSVINTFNIVSPTDRLNSPSHSALHNSVSSVLAQVQTVIGTDTASALGTIIGDLRNPDSGGGGHVQTAIKGGTGQTTFTKGDLLVATGPSVISKFAVGADGQIPKADSSVAAGIKWVDNTTPLVKTSASVITVINTVAETSLFSATIPGSTLGTNKAVRATLYISQYGASGNSGSVLLTGLYGGGVISSMMIRPSNDAQASLMGKLELTMVANTSATVQRNTMMLNLSKNRLNPAQSSALGLDIFEPGTSSVNSNADQTFGATIRFSDQQTGDNIRVEQYVVEKIT